MNFFDSVFRFIKAVEVAELKPYLESRCGGQAPVKFAICGLRFFEVADTRMVRSIMNKVWQFPGPDQAEIQGSPPVAAALCAA